MSTPDASIQESDSNVPFILRRHWRRRVMAVCFPGALLLGTLGFLESQRDEHAVPSVSNALYHSFQLFAFHSAHFEKPVPWTLEAGRWMAAVTTVLAGFGLARRMLHEERTALHLRRVQGHAVVCGLGRRGMEIVRRLRREERAVVVIDKGSQPALAEACHKCGAHLVIGDATDPETLSDARVQVAGRLIAICPDDGTNCEIASQAGRLRSAAKGPLEPLECQVHLSNVDLRVNLQKTMGGNPATGRMSVQFFDFYDPEARQVLVHDLPLDHGGIAAADPRAVHLVILGFGRMGRTLAVRAAQLGQFANGRRLRISVIDRLVEETRASLLFRYPLIAQVSDLEFHALEAVSPEAWALLQRWCGDPAYLTSVVVCFDNEQRGLEIAVQLLPLLKANDVRLAVRMGRRSGLASLIAGSKGGSDLWQRIRSFGMDERIALIAGPGSNSAERFAQEIHAAYVEMRRKAAAPAPEPAKALVDEPAMRAWDQLPEDLRESNRQQADHLFFKVRALACDVVAADAPGTAISEFTPPQIEMLAEWEHRRWLAERVIANWTFGQKKDVERRESPSLQPWDRLSKEVQDLDRIVVRRIPGLLAAVGKKIVSTSPPAPVVVDRAMLSQPGDFVSGGQLPTEEKPGMRLVLNWGSAPPDLDAYVLSPSADPLHYPPRETKPPEDPVHFTVTAPASLLPAAQYIIDVWAHLDDQRGEVLRRAREEAGAGGIKNRSQGPTKVSRGQILAVRLRLPGFRISPRAAKILWAGEIGNAQFQVAVPADCAVGTHHGLATILAEGISIARLRFEVIVANQPSGPAGVLPATEMKYSSVYASYASADRDEVVGRIQGLRKGRPDLKVFFDVEALRAGEHWQDRLRREILTRDALLLFWSQAASRSRWVEWEWRCALKEHGLDFIDPVPLVSPENVPPPAELSALHFNDPALAFLSGGKGGEAT